MRMSLFLLLFSMLLYSCESIHIATIENNSGNMIKVEFTFHSPIDGVHNQLGWRHMTIKNLDTNEEVTDNYNPDFYKITKDSTSMIIELENNQYLEMSNGMNTPFAFYYLKSLKVTFEDGGEIFAKNSAIINLFNINEEPGYTTRKSVFRIEQSFSKNQYNSIRNIE